MAEVSDQGLYPAEHRGLRELHASARALVRHWEHLADALGEPAAAPLRDGARHCRELLSQLSERGAQHEVHGIPGAQGLGGQIAALRRGGDRFLERNQALRWGLLDLEQVVVLLDWLGALAKRRDDAEWVAFHSGWSGRLSRCDEAVRVALRQLAADPDGAVEPAYDSGLGRVAHRVGLALGTAGEAVDSSALGRAVRRKRSR